MGPGPRTIMQITAELEPKTGWTKHAVISFLKRMEKKGEASWVEEGRTRAYSPAYPKGVAAAEEGERVLDRVFGGSLWLMVSSMAGSRGLSEEEFAELTDILKRAEEGRRG